MSATEKKAGMSKGIIGAGVLIGTGVGFFFLEISEKVFVGCILLGLGLGLMVASIISSRRS